MRVLKWLFLLMGGTFLFFLIWVYKDTVLSTWSRSQLKGKIVYARGEMEIKTIDLPSCRKEDIYYVRSIGGRYLEYVYYPYFSPNGRSIIFNRHVSRYELYIMDSNGKNVQPFLNTINFGVCCPSWSPDGKSIAFIVEDKLYKGLYVVDADNPDNPRKIIDAMPVLNQPSWSADSKMIAFAYEKISTKYLSANVRMERQIGGIYVVDVKTGQIRRHIPLARQPAWSPKEDLLVFERDYKYYLMNVNDFSESSEKYLLSNNPNPFGDRASRPITWSPDGKYIAFWREIWPGLAGLYAVSIDNPRKQIRISEDSREIFGMSWGE